MVLKGTVDNNIYQIAQRKLRLDKEVLEVRQGGSAGEGAEAPACTQQPHTCTSWVAELPPELGVQLLVSALHGTGLPAALLHARP